MSWSKISLDPLFGFDYWSELLWNSDFTTNEEPSNKLQILPPLRLPWVLVWLRNIYLPYNVALIHLLVHS